MNKSFYGLTILASALLLSACHHDIAYQPALSQGIWITQTQVSQIHNGMSKAQVENLLGSPLIENTFSSNHWTYIYELRKKGRLVDHRRAVISFQGNSVTNVAMNFSAAYAVKPS